jgi:hypothetical protein
MTGDPISSREYYSLGALYEVPELCAALGSLFLGGGPGKASEPPLDEEAVPVAGTSILLAANGYKAGEGIGPESHIRYPRPAVTLRPNVPARFQLRGGQSSSSSASTSGRSEGTSIPSLLRGRLGTLFSSGQAVCAGSRCSLSKGGGVLQFTCVLHVVLQAALFVSCADRSIVFTYGCRYPGAGPGVRAPLNLQQSSGSSRCSDAGATSRCSARAAVCGTQEGSRGGSAVRVCCSWSR